MSRRREREDYAPDEKEPWEKREEQIERKRKKREEQAERKREKRDKERKEKKSKKIRYEEEDREKRVSVPPRMREHILEEPHKPVSEPFYDSRLDIEQYTSEPTFTERLHGVTRARAPPAFLGRLESIGMKYEEFMEGPSKFFRDIGGKTLTKAEEAKLAGKDVQAGALFSSYMAQRSLAGAWGGLTLPFRPVAMIRTIQTGIGLIVDPKVRKGVVETAKADPGGFTAELGGGVLGGTVVGATLRKAGIVKPSSYRLRKTTKAREVTSPATLMPTGKYPSSAFDIKLWKTGGTSTLLLKDPGLMTVYEPVPVYKPSLTEPGMGLLSGLRPFSVSEKKPSTRVRMESVVSVPKGYLDVIQRTETLTKPTIRGVTETALILKPVAYTEKKPRLLVLPRIAVAPKPTTRTREKPVQEQRLRQIQEPILRVRTHREPIETKIRVPFLEKKKKGRGVLDLATIGEIRIYPVKSPEKLLKRLRT